MKETISKSIIGYWADVITAYAHYLSDLGRNAQNPPTSNQSLGASIQADRQKPYSVFLRKFDIKWMTVSEEDIRKYSMEEEFSEELFQQKKQTDLQMLQEEFNKLQYSLSTLNKHETNIPLIELKNQLIKTLSESLNISQDALVNLIEKTGFMMFRISGEVLSCGGGRICYLPRAIEEALEKSKKALPNTAQEVQKQYQATQQFVLPHNTGGFNPLGNPSSGRGRGGTGRSGNRGRAGTHAPESNQ